MKRIILFLCISLYLTISCSEETVVQNPTQMGSIFIDSNPQGAMIFLLGTNTNKLTPDSILNLESGDYEITLKFDSYKDTTVVANVKNGLRTTIFIEMDSKFGSLIVTSNPSGANIFIDDSVTGKFTPDTIKQIVPGNHTIKLSKVGFIDVETTLSIIKGIYSNLDVILQEDFSYWWTVYDINNSPLPSNYVVSIVEDYTGNLWIATLRQNVTDGGLAKYDGVNWTIYNVANSPIGSNSVIDLAVDKNNNLWIGTVPEITGSGGLMKFDGINWTVFDSSNTIMTSNDINALAVDEDNIVWVGTLNHGGLYSYDGSVWNSYLSGAQIESIAVDNNNVKWISGQSSNYVIWKYDNSNWQSFPVDNFGIPNSVIWAIGIDENSNKWFGSRQNGLVKYDENNSTVIDLEQYGIESNSVRDIAFSNTEIWLACNVSGGTGGVLTFKGELWKAYTKSLHNSLWDVNTILVDRNNIKWIGTRDGLLKYTGGF